jgi:hypothetical protein
MKSTRKFPTPLTKTWREKNSMNYTRGMIFNHVTPWARNKGAGMKCNCGNDMLVIAPGDLMPDKYLNCMVYWCNKCGSISLNDSVGMPIFINSKKIDCLFSNDELFLILDAIKKKVNDLLLIGPQYSPEGLEMIKKTVIDCEKIGDKIVKFILKNG